MIENNTELSKTSLYGLHLDNGAKMVPFAGYWMPVQYRGGIIQEHKHTRCQVGLFDISHMGQIKITGENVLSAVERLVPGLLTGLQPYTQKYTVLTNPEGGIIDDVMIMHAGDHVRMVVNAACKNSDLAYLQNKLENRCVIEMLESESLLALQGPVAARILGKYIPAVTELTFMTVGKFVQEEVEFVISRSGYTGEDGFEISLPDDYAERFAKLILAEDEVALIGLGARDTLRLEAGLCLYGQDIDNTTTPVEAALEWLVPKADQLGGDIDDYPGVERIRNHLHNGTERRRVGLKPQSKVPLRTGTVLLNDQQEQIGHISSGGYSPTLEKPVAMGYVRTEYTQPGTCLVARSRGKEYEIAVTGLPFVEHRYCHKNTRVK
jgi:aminomethyltransferase